MRSVRIAIRGLLLVLGLSLLAACGSAGASTTASSAGTAASAAPGQLPVVATTSIIGDLVQNVGGERVVVRTLLPAGADPHTFAPSPADVQTISGARLLFENGLGLEGWLQELTSNAGGSRTTVVVSDGLTPLAGAAHDHDEEASAEAEAHADEHAEGADPHMWFDVANTIRYVENIRDALKQADPAGAATYDGNAAAYIAELQKLDAEIQRQVESIPAERRKLVTNHDVWGYFAKRYGFEVVGSVFAGLSTEEEPSAQQVATLVQAIREQSVPAIFTENTVNPRLAQQVGDEAGVKVVTDLYTDALGEPGSAGDTYLKLMRHDVTQIVAALR